MRSTPRPRAGQPPCSHGPMPGMPPAPRLGPSPCPRPGPAAWSLLTHRRPTQPNPRGNADRAGRRCGAGVRGRSIVPLARRAECSKLPACDASSSLSPSWFLRPLASGVIATPTGTATTRVIRHLIISGTTPATITSVLTASSETQAPLSDNHDGWWGGDLGAPTQGSPALMRLAQLRDRPP